MDIRLMKIWMTESGKPVANEIIHKADTDGFVTKVDWRDDDYGTDGTIRRYYYETASGYTHPFVSSISNVDYGQDGHLIEKKALTTALVGKVNTSDVLSLEEIQATTNLTGKVAGADSIKTLINNRIFKIKNFHGQSSSKTSVTFYNVPIKQRVSGIIVGNANNRTFFRYCALFHNGGVGSEEQAISEGTITTTASENGTANITISDVRQWGEYNLIVFYGS